ncbi:MAG: hypothetical protein LT102_15865 [Burkholderiaceae bacterium]|nr:hypothetical protein [Burkholderiaceae bacterium]
MALEALLARLEADSVTPVTPAETADVTAKPAPVLACTAVTPVTSCAGVTERATLWLLHFPDLDPVAVAFAPERDQAEVLAAYPDALAAEPVPEETATVPADALALFDACAKAGLYDDDDRAALPAMFALDPEGVRRLIEAMHERIASCRRCRHFRRPGLSDGYCTGRDDLPHAHGLLHELPDDEGMRCNAFERV